MTERKDAFAGFVGEKFSFSPDWIPAEDCSAWLKTRRGRKRDSEAASLEEDLARPEAFGAACARLRQLAKAGSGYASWLLGDRLARGEGLEKDEEAARPLLEKAAAAGIGPACWRLNCLDGDEAADSDLLRRGLAAGSIRCARA
ncbi:MAG: hypothetical protein Q4F72_05955, partial [Desulfovibrionaceae bacterium]|nr:hypothetical protein [Desulfovibrionaceae bacterium]